MPLINLKMTPGPTPAQKARFIEAVTKLASGVLGKNPATTHASSGKSRLTAGVSPAKRSPHARNA